MAHHNNERILTLHEIAEVVSMQQDTTTGDNLLDVTFRLLPDVKLESPQGIFLGNDILPRYLLLPQPAEESQEETAKSKRSKKAEQTNGGTN